MDPIECFFLPLSYIDLQVSLILIVYKQKPVDISNKCIIQQSISNYITQTDRKTHRHSVTFIMEWYQEFLIGNNLNKKVAYFKRLQNFTI